MEELYKIKEEKLSEEAKIIIDVVLRSEDNYEAEEAVIKRLKRLMRIYNV